MRRLKRVEPGYYWAVPEEFGTDRNDLASVVYVPRRRKGLGPLLYFNCGCESASPKVTRCRLSEWQLLKRISNPFRR